MKPGALAVLCPALSITYVCVCTVTGPHLCFEGLSFESKVPSLGTFRRSPRGSRHRVRKVTEIAEDWYHARAQASRRCSVTHRGRERVSPQERTSERSERPMSRPLTGRTRRHWQRSAAPLGGSRETPPPRACPHDGEGRCQAKPRHATLRSCDAAWSPRLVKAGNLHRR